MVGIVFGSVKLFIPPVTHLCIATLLGKLESSMRANTSLGHFLSATSNWKDSRLGHFGHPLPWSV